MEAGRPLFIPVILGTTRMGRMSLHAAQLVTGELGKCAGVETDLIDIAKLPLPTSDAGEAIKQADSSARMNKADALVVVSPEYNHGYSGLLNPTPHLTNLMLVAVACTAQSQQVILGVVAAATTSIDVMDVQLRSATARLTPPTIAR